MEWMRETNEMRLAYSDALIERGRADESASAWWRPT